MSWACSYTGITSIFNDRQRIGISSDCSNPATAIDFVNVAVQSDIRTIFVQPGNEQAVVAAVAKACERKDVSDVDFKYIMALNRNDHMVQNMLEKKIRECCTALNVRQLDLVLLPWPVLVGGDGGYDRKEKTKQGAKMRETWNKLCTMKSTLVSCVVIKGG